MRGDYSNHVIAITGAAQGMGREMALLLARSGCAGLALADFNEKALEQTRQDIGDKCPVSTHVVDVRSVEDLERFRDETLEKHKRCSVLVNNAGIAALGFFEDQTKEYYDRTIKINFDGVVDCTRVFLPLLKREKSAHLINISSMYGYFATDNNSNYHASKFAVRGFTEALATECTIRCPQVKVHCVHPGYVRSQLMENADLTQITREDALDMFKRIGLTNSDQAAKMILEGAMRNQFRIRVGPDAYLLDFLPRLLPGTYLVNPRFRKFCFSYVMLNSYAAARIRDTIGLSDASCVFLVLLAQAIAARAVLRRLLGK
ncbi:Dehydrogenase/reductase SDR family protein 7-like [Hondaea fermentalgiana]|uniref:Dehydrogenase/reductase SDR family protein 7-like n=1 Tax=Hondaea fermentalgiana TaxID=2315210 RepID=A0A2R5GWF2_9STRA|nr:Dehydrogenase/reductase SDR family protein 7-like [Hondaea fermentalgiana]|eukprot:GBG35160.1 Dehydrogenase/reductase SDR family protein 7-like [Hondaea fermentalgiana]